MVNEHKNKLSTLNGLDFNQLLVCMLLVTYTVRVGPSAFLLFMIEFCYLFFPSYMSVMPTKKKQFILCKKTGKECNLNSQLQKEPKNK